MFGNKKMYKKGLADAMRAYEDFGKKQEEAIAALRAEVHGDATKLEAALSNLGEELNGIYDYLDAKEKAALYHLSTPFDIKKLEVAEQNLLLAVLIQLSNNQVSATNEYQKTYIHGVKQYLGIANPQTQMDDLSVVGEIDSGIAQKAILQTVLEFFYLQDGDELTDAQEEFLENFSVNKKQALAIEGAVSRLYNATGAEGLAEKYGNSEVLQLAQDQALEMYASFEQSVKSWKAYSSFCHIFIEHNSSDLNHLAASDSESFKDKSRCQREAERQLRHYHRETEKALQCYTECFGDKSVIKKLINQVDSFTKNQQDKLLAMRSPRSAAILDKITPYLSKTKIVDELNRKRDSLILKYAMPDVDSYQSEIEYEVYDPSEFEDGFLAKALAKNYKRYGYNIFNVVIDTMRHDAEECGKEYIEEMASYCDELYDRYISDPIQQLLPELYDALCAPTENS